MGLSSRWERKLQSPESTSAQNSMHLLVPSFASTRSHSRVGSSGIFTHPRETSEGVLSNSNSPSESFHYLQSPSLADVGNTGDLIIRPSGELSTTCLKLKALCDSADTDSRSSGSVPCQGTGISAVCPSLESACQKEPEDVAYGISNRQSSRLSQSLSSSSPFLSKPASSIIFSRQRSDNAVSYAGGSSKMASMETESLRHRTGTNVPRLTRENSDPWTIQAFSELIASSRLENSGWPNVDISSDLFVGTSQENFSELGISYIEGRNMTQSHINLQVAPHAEAQKCGLCTKPISQRSPWSPQRILGSSDLPVVGILVCGHVYHAECLEQATPIMQMHEPPCPQCNVLEKVFPKFQGEIAVGSTSKTPCLTGSTYGKGKLSRVGVATDDFSGAEFSSKNLRFLGKIPSSPEATSRKMGLHLSALSGERGFLTKPLLKRQFSLRGKFGKDPTFVHSPKKPGSPAKVSPENNIGEDSPSASHGRKGQSSAFAYLKRWH